MFGRLSDAVSDFSETLRRLFRDPDTHTLDPMVHPPQVGAVSPLTTESITPPYALCPLPKAAQFTLLAFATPVPTRFEGSLKAENAWASWAAGAKICQMAIFGKSGGLRVDIPPLPRRASSLRKEAEAFLAATRSLREPFSCPAVRGGSPELGSAVARKGLELALGLPIAFLGQDVQTLPRPLWMRYSLQLVKTTGENIRTLDVLGIYRIPSKGVASMRHDPTSGKLFLEMTPEAAQAPRLPFLLARRKVDRSLVSCFLEEG